MTLLKTIDKNRKRQMVMGKHMVKQSYRFGCKKSIERKCYHAEKKKLYKQELQTLFSIPTIEFFALHSVLLRVFPFKVIIMATFTCYICREDDIEGADYTFRLACCGAFVHEYCHEEWVFRYSDHQDCGLCRAVQGKKPIVERFKFV